MDLTESLSPQQLMELSQNWQYTRTQSKSQQIQENWNTFIPIWSPRIKVEYQKQQKRQKVHNLMETEQLCQDRNQEGN